MNLNPFFRSPSSQFTNLLVWPFRTVIVCALLAFGQMAAYAQEQTPSQEGSYEFVSGTITEVSAERIIVNRSVMSKAAENRTFLITGDTKIEGKLRAKARVTVGFKTTDEGDVAVRIIVRSGQGPTPTPKKP